MIYSEWRTGENFDYRVWFVRVRGETFGPFLFYRTAIRFLKAPVQEGV